MNIEVTDQSDPDSVAARRAANDAFRATLTNGSLVLTAGIIALGAANQARIIEAVRRCRAFDDDDPFDAHDIGDVTVTLVEPGIARWPELIFFKVVDDTGPTPADCPDSPSQNPTRQLILMLASEW